MGFSLNPVDLVKDVVDLGTDVADATTSAVDGVVDATVSVADAIASVTVSVADNVADAFVDAGNAIVSTGSTLCNSVADGAVATFNTASGGVVYAVDWTETEATKVSKYAVDAVGDIAHFSVELYGKAQDWAKDALKYLEELATNSPPQLGPYDDSARDAAIAVVAVYNPLLASSIVASWERYAKLGGYTMAIDFCGTLQIGIEAASAAAGVYVDKKGKWGYLANASVSVTLIPDAAVTLTCDLYILFGGVSMYAKDKSYYFIGGSFDIEGVILGGDVIVSTSFEFAGFQTTIGIGLDMEEGSNSKKTKVEAAPTIPSLTSYNVNLLGDQGSTYQVACEVASDPSQETSITANAAGAMTHKSATILASDMIGGSGGGAFSDDVTNVRRVKSVTLHGGTYVNGIAITYELHDGTTATKSHGSTSGTSSTLTLSEGEYITKVTGKSGSLVDSVSLTTSHGQTISAGGSGGGSFTINPYPNRPIIGFFGRCGSNIDALGVYYVSGVPFTIQSKQSGLYLDVDGQMSADDGASTVQQGSTGGPHQQWLLSPGSAEGEYYIVNAHTGLYLTGPDSSAGTSVVQSEATGDDTQVWSLMARSAGYYQIAHKSTGLRLDVKGASSAAGTQVLAWALNGNDNQLWRLAPVSPKVYVYSGGGYTGTFQAFGPGSYDLSALTIGNDTIRSIQVPDGWRVTAYQHSGFAGTTQVLTRDTPELGTLSGEVSSLKVEMPPWGATLYTNVSYAGTSLVLMPGRYSSLKNLGYSNDAVSSVNVPDGWRVTLFSDENFGGTMTVLTSSASNLKDQGVNDSASSVVVESDPLGQVVLFQHARYQGTAQALDPGKWDVATLRASGGVGDNTVSSVKVPPNWTVILYENASFTGRAKTLTADCSSLDDFNDLTSSVIVIPG